MVRFKDKTVFTHDTSNIFDKTHGPGVQVPHSGIYKCQGCGIEAACNLGDPLPPQNKHQHGLMATGPIAWKLIAATDT